VKVINLDFKYENEILDLVVHLWIKREFNYPYKREWKDRG